MLRILSISVLVALMFVPTLAQEQDTTVPPQPVELNDPPGQQRSIPYTEALETADENDVLAPPQWAIEETLAFVSVNRANIRTQPDIQAGIVTDIAVWGERFPIVGVFYPGEPTVREPETDDFVFDDPNEREIWYLVETGGGAGWIFGGVVIVANPETLDAFEERTLTPEQQAYIDAQVDFAARTINVRVTSRLRSGPGTNFSQVGIIPFSSRVAIIGRNEFSTWFFVEYNGQRGWLNFGLLSLPTGYDATTVPIIR
ncbi:MAG: SH3 domain-containing protein [Anaerolineae bacterium]